ncbi:MAG: hypothetical protein J6M60_04610 [Clostridia bacterium]|nr:hypothetical protein [Clostridia bacterium]
MKSTKKILFSVILVIALIMAILPNSVRAENEKIKEVNVTVKGPEVGTTIEHGTEKVSYEIPDVGPYEFTADILIPKPNATVSSDSNYKVANSYWIKYLPSMGDEYEYDPKNTTFEISASGKYYIEVGIEPKDGYEFADDVVLKVNGKTSGFELNEYNYEQQCMFYMEVTPVAALPEDDEEEPAKEEEKKNEEQTKEEEKTTEEETNKEDEKEETKKESTVVAEDTANEEEVAAAEEVGALVDDVLAGKEVEGIDAETATKVVAAKAAGKEVKVDFSSKEVKKEEVAEDVEKAEQKLAANEKIAGIFDVSINLKAGNDQLGKVTKLNKKVAFKLPIPEELRTVPAGYERIFSMLRIHDGLTSRMDVDSDGENVSGESDEYSTYVLTYTDKKITSNPETGDMIALSVAIFAITTAGAVVVFRKLK